MNYGEMYPMNAAAQVAQLAFQEAAHAHAPEWSRVDFGFHTTSSYLSDERTLSENGHYLIEMKNDPVMALGAFRPGGNPTGELDDVPIGDVVLPMLLIAVGYTLWRKISHLAHMSVKH